MGDDFRVKVTVGDRRQAVLLGEKLAGGEIAHELAQGAHNRVVVSVDDHDLFLYADTREQAQAAATAIGAAARQEGWHADIELARWHPVAQEWADPDQPLPATEADVASEHSELVARERSESERSGIPEYEVRIECASHRPTVALSERLAAEGIPSLRRWRYLLIGAPDEESAQALADRLTSEVEAGSTVTVEATFATVARETPANPFAVFGGLGV
jgi:hypothetical protein